MWRLINCFKVVDTEPAAHIGGRAPRTDEPERLAHYRAPVVTPPPRASSASSLAAASSASSDSNSDHGRDVPHAYLLPKRGALQSAASEGGTSSSMTADTASSERRHRRTGSGPSGTTGRAWQLPDVPAPPRPRSALGRSGSSSKLAGGKYGKGAGSSVSLAELAAGGGVGTEMLLAGGDQDEDEDDCCPTCLEVYTPDNPRIWTRCGHHYHLACMYAWAERKDTCPLCEKRISIDEIV